MQQQQRRATSSPFAQRLPHGWRCALLCALVGCDEGRRVTAPDGGGGSETSSGNAGSSAGGAAGTGSSDALPASCLPSGQVPGLKLTEVVDGLSQPTFVSSAPGDATRLYILEQRGRLLVLENGDVLDPPFIELEDRITNEGNEQGLLGLAFHPDYATNGRFFLHYSSSGVAEAGINAGDGVISEFKRSADSPTRADPASERRLLRIPQPFSNHNGGMLAFSPKDGFLYAGLGDGGSANDPQGNGQKLNTLLGKMLRIDVDAAPAGRSYGIPAGNMTGGDTLPEIWSYGWRNPWRFSFDSCTGDLYVGDVGQNRFEELDFEPANTGGRNYGWSEVEGNACLEGNSCDRSGITAPVLDYPRSYGASVTGGYVYRGAAMPGLRGYYFYGDYATGNIGRFRIENGAAVDAMDITSDINPDGVNEIASFGSDANGELLLVDRGGVIYRIEAD
jgi:glucose/arabinose dehydrogenase